jgi:hypothetical protein
MFAKVKSPVFIDTLKFEMTCPSLQCVRGILKDDTGIVCRTMEKNNLKDREELTWEGLNDLPYGRYTLELSHGDDEMKMNLVKRV